MTRVFATDGSPTLGEYVRPAADRLADARARGYRPITDFITPDEHERYKAASREFTAANDRLLNVYAYAPLSPQARSALKRTRRGALTRKNNIIKKAEARRDAEGYGRDGMPKE